MTFRAILTSLVLASLAFAGGDGKAKTAISGTVVAGNIPVPGLTVLMLSATGDTLAQGFTNDTGSFELQGVPLTLDDGFPSKLEILWGARRVLYTQSIRVSDGLRGIVYRLR